MTRPLSRTPFVLLGLLTIATFGGPIAIYAAIRGGRNPDWPPDRPIEWWTFSLITGLVIILMSACLAIGLANWRQLVRLQKEQRRDATDRGSTA